MLQVHKIPSPDQYDLKTLSCRLAILVCLTAGKRDQTISYMNFVPEFVPEPLKQTRLRQHMVLTEYSDTDIFALSHLGKIREVTKRIRKSNKLLLNYVKPHKPIFPPALSRWCVSTLQQAGDDTTVFESHSNRSALTFIFSAKSFIRQRYKQCFITSPQKRNIFQK